MGFWLLTLYRKQNNNKIHTEKNLRVLRVSVVNKISCWYIWAVRFWLSVLNFVQKEKTTRGTENTEKNLRVFCAFVVNKK